MTGGLWDEQTAGQEFGPLQISGGPAVLSLPTNFCVIHFSDSSSLPWSARLSITNWSGSTSGGGMHQVIFGSNYFSLTGAQLGQVIFDHPNGLASGWFPAQLLPTGEIVPDTRTPMSPVLTMPVRKSSGAMELMVNGQFGTPYGVLVSTDLFHWYFWSNQFCPQGGTMIFLDSDAPNYSHRFYRAVRQLW